MCISGKEPEEFSSATSYDIRVTDDMAFLRPHISPAHLEKQPNCAFTRILSHFSVALPSCTLSLTGRSHQEFDWRLNCSGDGRHSFQGGRMRSELVFGAIHQVADRYLLVRLAAKAIRAFHRPNTSLSETANEVLRRFALQDPRAPVRQFTPQLF